MANKPASFCTITLFDVTYNCGVFNVVHVVFCKGNNVFSCKNVTKKPAFLCVVMCVNS